MALTRPRLLGALVTTVVAVAIVTGIVMLGSPSEERRRRLDQRRVQDLTNLARAVDLYWTRHATLPASVPELLKEPGGRVSATDPGTSEQYEYRVLDGGQYELCARFERESRDAGSILGDNFWAHAPGRQCFRREPRKVS